MIGRDVWAWLRSEHGEGLPDILIGPPDAGDAKPRPIPFDEKPLVLALLLFVRRISELIEAIGDDETPARGELAPL
jgi:hypothetical protein